ncbi:hypothetical protein H2248_001288 [Termitomyces sp. 'cryptogamus']|nr:hypothetical protein H2248_001288 [Termitomyces sp. 'cryptogamus']
MRALRGLAHLRPPPPTAPGRRPDGFALLAPELAHVRASLLGLLGSAHPGLAHVARFAGAAQQLRSVLVLLCAHATNGRGAQWPNKHAAPAAPDHDIPLTRPGVLHNSHPSMPTHPASFTGVFHLRIPRLHTDPPRAPAPPGPPRLLPTQLRLAQIVEMVHIASVLHDGVHEQHENKLSILAGDFLLGRASAALARLGEPQVVELIASVISNQAEGEMLRHLSMLRDPWDMYLRRSYLKTASLMAKGACASVALGGCSDHWQDAAYTYGRNLGIAYQLVQDTLEHPLGITGPVLFAAEEHPDLHPLIRRNLAGEGDIQKARHYVARSQGIDRTRALAATYADKAREALRLLPESEYREALDVLAESALAT